MTAPSVKVALLRQKQGLMGLGNQKALVIYLFKFSHSSYFHSYHSGLALWHCFWGPSLVSYLIDHDVRREVEGAGGNWRAPLVHLCHVIILFQHVTSINLSCQYSWQLSTLVVGFKPDGDSHGRYVSSGEAVCSKLYYPQHKHSILVGTRTLSSTSVRIRQQSLSPPCRGSIWTLEGQSQSSFTPIPSPP